MRFGRTLRTSVYPPWKDEYIDYAKLKDLLREDAEDDPTWTEEDENKFCEEILNVQLEKVAAFQASTFQSLEQRTNKAGEKLRELAPEEGRPKGEITTGRFKEIEAELDSIINETKELKRYSNINYTGFLKIVKKHDRKRGNSYKIRPMLQIRLLKRPFNSEQGYSPLLNKLSTMYFVVRQQLDETADPATATSSDSQSQMQNGEKYTAYKCKVYRVRPRKFGANPLSQSGSTPIIFSRSKHIFSVGSRSLSTANNQQRAASKRKVTRLSTLFTLTTAIAPSTPRRSTARPMLSHFVYVGMVS